MYSALLLDHFQNPRYAGELPDADFTVRQENPVCGDILELCARVRKGVIEEIRFRAKGCVPTMACGSAACELAAGKPISEIREISKEDVIDAVGGVPNGSDHAAQLALDTLKSLLAEVK
ncbi:MAG: iron-sulfur cluster assembly scaffold protein [Terriglobia bacterium]|jgi:nitrogen fixation NifU-like protein|nr:iron-sulfur cluster assembly scaffold protein [Terriglobia bacterium]